ncbi:hypothetical protein ABZ618_32350 [Streptomyces roseolus]|uniref:hypothetical protein n=1 Tax=Streptomyces roseolus TaxID=67358 RepID=UPI0033DF8BEE
MTDIGKPSKVPLRLDSTGRAISTALAGLGVADEQIRCELADGRPTVSLPPVADPGQRRRIVARLAPYDVNWAFTDLGSP